MSERTYEDLNKIFEERVRPLKDRRTEINENLNTLSCEDKEKVLSAQIAVLSRKIEEETALGDLTRAKNFESEIATVQTELETLVERKQSERLDLVEELDRINNELKTIAQRVISEYFPSCSEAFIVKINTVLDFIDDVRAGFGQFASENGVPTSNNLREHFRPHAGGSFGDRHRRLWYRFQKVGWL